MQVKLFPEARLHGNALASFSAAAGENGPSALCFHSRAKTVHLGTTAPVRLKSALGHGLVELLLRIVCAEQTISIFALGKRQV